MNSSKIKVLIFPAGEVSSIALHDALSTCVNIELWGASSIERHGSFVFKNYISGLPMITEDNFIKEFNKIISDKKIDLVFPTHDTVANFLSQNEEKIKTKIACCDKRTAQICRDKQKIYNLFKDCPFMPKIYKEINEFPVFIKPREGQGGVGAKIIKTKTDIPSNINLDDYVICEYLPNEEYSVDCLTDKDGKLIYISPRSRQRIMAGIAVAGEVEPLSDDISNIAYEINKRLKFKGLWFFQIKKDKNNKWKLLEIATRYATTMCLSQAKGVNLPLLSVYIEKGYDVLAKPNSYNVKMDRTLISRYKIDYKYETVYFDFDDTLIINNQVHLPAIRFLYQCKNQNKNVILITKHENDLNKTLEKYAISKNLFNKIIHLKMNDKKINHIKPENAIFIDNAFQERIAVQDKFNIPVFDVEGIAVLTDWRE
jgi:predicted ATP-grasp superfamily ATP-dependent carboligase